MQIDREGKFRGFPLSWGIDQKDSGAVQFAINMSAAEMLNTETGEWENVEQYAYEMTAFLNLIKIDKTPNEITTKQLITALGWDGLSYTALQETDWSQKLVEYSVGWSKGDEKYPSKLEIKFGSGELKRLDAAAIKSLDQRFSATLRALAPKPAAGATAARPAAPRPPVRTPATPPPAAAAEGPLEPGSVEVEEQQPETQAPTDAPTATKPPPRRPLPPGPKKYG